MQSNGSSRARAAAWRNLFPRVRASFFPNESCQEIIGTAQFHNYCGTVKNITVAVDDQTYHTARIEAARRRTSVSGLVREFLVGISGESAATQEKAKKELAK